MAQAPDNMPLARALGAFFGHIWKGVKTSPKGTTPELRSDSRPESRKVAEESSEHTDAQGRTIRLRRTVIEEIEVSPPRPPAENPPSP